MTENQSSPWTKSTGQGAPKYNGKSTYSLSQAIGRRAEATATKRTVLRLLEAQEREADERIASEVAILIGGLNAEQIQVRFVHDCPDSPTRHCIYREDDHCRDECIFCGDPEERK